VATCGKIGKLESHLFLDLLPCATQQGTESEIKPELRSVQADEIEDRAHSLVCLPPKTAAKLLDEKGGTFGGPEKQEGVHSRDIDAFIKKVHRKYDTQLP
jgi:hypothetical protein